ncbi:MAG: ATP-binding protein [Lachnospiraceae bacterium]|jgi:hypothetical protein|nr:ATP-binding protein [Lachnospiraceae bacterium]
MEKNLNPSNAKFLNALRSDPYVDKTNLISYTNRLIGTEQRFLCVSRPRRFGKSITAHMLAAYYSRGCDSKDIFQSLKIAEDAKFEEHLNQYDVIYINIQQYLFGLADLKDLCTIIQSSIQKELKDEYGVFLQEDKSKLSAALSTVFAQIKREKSGFIFIIDEWDCLFREAKKRTEVQKEYLDFLRDLFKDQEYVKMVYMTGILPIKKYGTHSALNIFDEYAMTDPSPLESYVGFTEEEVKDLCAKHQRDFDEVQRWYDGYWFPNECHIYNPKSVVTVMLRKTYQSYWTSTETYEGLQDFIDMNFDGLRESIVQLLGGEHCKVNVMRFKNDMTTFRSKDDVLTLLVHLGYLAYDYQKKEVFIPNHEIREEFINAMEGTAWNPVIMAMQASDALLDATWQMDEASVAKRIDAVHEDMTSILNYNNENALSCVINLAYYTARNEYSIIREFPTGKGFADVVFLPRKHSMKPAIVVELKWNRSAEGAIAQIKSKNYGKGLTDYAGEVLMVGINYDKESKEHQCLIEKIIK